MPIIDLSTDECRLLKSLLDAAGADHLEASDVESLVTKFNVEDTPYWRTLPEEQQRDLVMYVCEDMREAAEIYAEELLDQMAKEDVDHYIFEDEETEDEQG